MRKCKDALLADYAQIQQYTSKYHAGSRPPTFAVTVIQSIGLQMMAAIRVMNTLDSANVPVFPKLISRLIRHVYGAEVHWHAKFDPGVTLVHGCGLVVSHAASIGSGALLFQNVTLGESMDPATKQIGAPTLGKDVHIGPGATLLGPIFVGDRTKIMAGAVLTQSVPPDSLVRAPEASISVRNGAKASQNLSVEID
jgi:serine O-acetyltransferase